MSPLHSCSPNNLSLDGHLRVLRLSLASTKDAQLEACTESLQPALLGHGTGQRCSRVADSGVVAVPAASRSARGRRNGAHGPRERALQPRDDGGERFDEGEVIYQRRPRYVCRQTRWTASERRYWPLKCTRRDGGKPDNFDSYASYPVSNVNSLLCPLPNADIPCSHQRLRQCPEPHASH